MNTAFLPQGSEFLRSEKKYWKPSQFENEVKFRIVQLPIAGWEDWHEKKPYRYKPSERPKRSFDESQPMKAFWACYVWDYSREDLYILTISQNSIIRSLTSLASDEDWGDLTGYDIKIKKEGTGKETKYHVNSVPHKPISDAIVFAVSQSPVRLEALYEGGDPWRDLEGQEETVQFSKVVPISSKPSSDNLLDLYKQITESIEVPDATELGVYLEYCQSKTEKPMSEVVAGWIKNPAPFLKHFQSDRWKRNSDG